MHFYLLAWHRITDFSGRSQRSEFWWFTMVNWAISLALLAVGGLVGLDFNFLLGLFSLAVLVPTLAVWVRRMHDVGRSGWWLLVGLVPVIGPLVLLFWSVKPSDNGINAFGQNPIGMVTSTA